MENKTGMKVAKKYQEAIAVIEKDIDGVWAYTNDGYKFDSSDCHTERQDNQKDLYKAIQTIVPCDCKACEAATEEDEAENEEDVEETDETEFENLHGDKVYTTKLNVYGVIEEVTIEVMNDSSNSVLMTWHGDKIERYAGILDGRVADFGKVYENDAHRLELVRKASEFIAGTFEVEESNETVVEESDEETAAFETLAELEAGTVKKISEVIEGHDVDVYFDPYTARFGVFIQRDEGRNAFEGHSETGNPTVIMNAPTDNETVEIIRQTQKFVAQYFDADIQKVNDETEKETDSLTVFKGDENESNGFIDIEIIHVTD